MGLFDHYKQYVELTDEEQSARLKEESDERRRKALARVEPLDLTKTTWPEYAPPGVVNAITFAARAGLQAYMESSGELRTALAHRHDVPAERIALGDGAAQLLSAATQALMEPGDELVTPWPSYPLYPVLARRARGDVVPVPGFGVEPILAAITGRTRIVALCNPNDPTGELLGAGDLRRLLTALPDRVVVLLDEALRDFTEAEPVDAALALAEEHPRLIAFRTFSKAWGLAGLRCGYAVGGPGSEPLLEQLGPLLGIGELAQAGVLEAVVHGERVLRRRVRTVAEARSRLTEGLRELGLEAPPSHANVLWIAAEGMDGAELSNRLARSSVIVRSGGPFGDQRHIRAAIHDRPSAERFLRALEQAIGA